MGKILKWLNIRPNEKGVFLNFFLFNMVLYTGIFLGRAIRDALFFSKIGADYLPLIFIINAITMSIFGIYFAKWTGKGYSLKNISLRLFSYSALIILLFSFLFSLDLSGSVPNTNLPLEKLAIFVFYFMTEIPLFLMVVVIWIIADGYISESMGQRLNPKIIGGGHIGIVIGGLVAVFAPQLFHIRMQSLSYVWGGIVFFEIFMIALIYKICKPLPREEEEELFEEVQIQEKTGFFREFLGSFKVVKKHKYSIYFALIALFTFFLFGINDYMLTSRAFEAGISEDKLVAILGYFTIGFGLLSALFQFTFFTKIIKKFGIAKTHLGAGLVFIIGSIVLFLTSTHMFEPVQKLIIEISDLEKTWLLLLAIAFARFGGYIAEYLFNQSLIPSIYGAIPEEDREITRTFIEGTFVQMVFGMTGILLIVYKFVFKDNLDFLILLGAVSASFMLTFAWKMIAEYKKMLTLSKTSLKDRILSKLIGPEIDAKKVQSFFAKNNTFITTSLIEFLAKGDKEEFAEDIFNQFGKGRNINVSVINGIITLNNLEYFDKLLEKFIEFNTNKQFTRFKRGDRIELRTLLSGFYMMHHNYNVMDMFVGIEENPNLTDDQKQEIIYFFSRLDNKAGIIKANQILQNIGDEELRLKLSAEVGFDHFSREIQAELEKLMEPGDKEPDVERLSELINIAAKINYSHRNVLFDIFKLILKSLRFLEVRPLSLSVARDMIQKDSFLALIAVGYFSKEIQNYSFSNYLFPVEELPGLLSNTPIIQEKDVKYLKGIYNDFSMETLPISNNHFSINLLLEDYIQKSNPALALNSYRALSQRIKDKIEGEDSSIKNAGLLVENEFKKLYLTWIVIAAFKIDNPAIYLFAQKRVDMYYKKSLLYSLSLLPDSDPFDVEHYYNNLMSNNRTLKDNAITLLEQAVPRYFFKKIDDYFYIDDESNTLRENELAAKARDLYPGEAVLDKTLQIFKDELLIKLINKQ